MDEIEEMGTQLMLLSQSISTAMSACSERISDIGSEVDALYESASVYLRYITYFAHHCVSADVKKAYGVI